MQKFINDILQNVSVDVALYIEINFVCIIILSNLFIKVFRDSFTQIEYKIFAIFLLSTLVHCFTDLLWKIISQFDAQNTIGINYILNIIYFINSGIGSYFWLLYVEYALDSTIHRSRLWHIIAGIPCIILSVLTLLSPFLHCIFYINPQGEYVRGSLHWIQLLIVSSYLIVPSIKSLHISNTKENYIFKRKYTTLATFIIWPIIFNILQFFTDKLPLSTVGVVIALVEVYINMRDYLISVDTLTQLNNRTQCVNYILKKFQSLNEHYKNQENSFYLMIIDINHFKQINDIYGHKEGDLSLQAIANNLKKISASKNIFLGRLGDDDFLLTVECQNDNDLSQLKTQILSTIAIENIRTEREYQLTVSIGVVKYVSEISSVNDFINLAYKNLHKQKMSLR